MSTNQASTTHSQNITPPSSFARPLTPPPTDQKQFPQSHQVIQLFEDIRDGRSTKRRQEIVFQLIGGEYDDIECRLSQDEELSRFVKSKIRYNYNGNTYLLIIRMPTGVHELFIDGVEDAFRSKLKAIRDGTGRKALFAQKVRPARSTEVELRVEDGRTSKYHPDTSFWHDDAEYPGVVIEVAYSQQRRRLSRIAEDYLLDSDANIRVVVGLDIEYGKQGSRNATLSVWRTGIFHTPDGDELRVVPEAVAETFRDSHGNPTNHPGLRLHLSDFAYKGLVQNEIGDQDEDLVVSAQQLCQFLSAAETKSHRKGHLGKDPVAPEVRKRKRSESPTEEVASGDERKYVIQEERIAKRMAKADPDYQ